ncbi:hypothetical protein ACF0H5_004545 [Mactra antiquata]
MSYIGENSCAAAEYIEEEVLDSETPTEEEMRMIRMMRTFGFKPKMENANDVIKLFDVIQELDKKEEQKVKTNPSTFNRSPAYPKFNIFYGEDGKGECNWETFKYEVECVQNERQYSEEQIMFGIRRALRGTAADKLRRLGMGRTSEYIMNRLDSDYSIVETKECSLKRFYNTEQKKEENIEKYAARLEDLFDKAVSLGTFNRSDTEILKRVLHSGLKKDIKRMPLYQLVHCESYDEFKRELRKMEADLKTSESLPCKPAIPTESENEMTKLLKQINSRIDDLEKLQQNKDTEKQQEEQQTPSHSWNRPYNRGRGYNRSRGGPNRGRGRPLARQTFSPTCFICNQEGHTQYKCPTILAMMTCTNCKEK